MVVLCSCGVGRKGTIRDFYVRKAVRDVWGQCGFAVFTMPTIVLEVWGRQQQSVKSFAKSEVTLVGSAPEV